MSKTVTEIARLLKGEVVGDGEAVITGIAGIAEAQPGEITFVDSPQYESFLETTAASAVIVGAKTDTAGKTIIRVDNPRLAFARAMRIFYPLGPKGPSGIHPSAVIGTSTRLGENVRIGAHTVIGDEVEIGDGAVIFPLVSIGARTRIGPGTVIHANVSIREGIEIGREVIVHSGTVIGSDGFGYAQDGQEHLKIPQAGTVIVEDQVEIGSNVSIDRGTLGATRIGRGTKIDNLVQIAHNVIIGPNTLLIAQVGLSGSTRIGANVILAGQVGVVGHIEIGDGAIVAAQSGVSKSISPRMVMFGSPARELKKAKQIEACISRLPDMYKRIHRLEKKAAPPQEEEE